MNAERLREAAKLMRERAEAATPGPWSVDNEIAWGGLIAGGRNIVNGCCDGDGYLDSTKDAEHIASWHPAVALAVADWMVGESLNPSAWNLAAVAVADAYLGDPS